MPGTLLINYILIYELKSIRKHPEWVSESCSVSADSLRLHGLYTVHGILQARILEWEAIPFSRESSQPRDQTQVSCIAGRFFISWATREPLRKCLKWGKIQLKKKNHSNICLDQKQMRQGKNIQSRWCRKTRAWPLGKNVICIWLSPSLINCGTICSKETTCVWGSGDKIYTRAMKPFRR